jgi:cytochrome c553
MKYLIILMSVLLFACASPTSSSKSKYNPPADHSISKEGVKHKPGFTTPLTNCISCHGPNLRGGKTDVSCYECHGKKW